MKKTEWFVLDTNILISAFILPNSLARQALDKARKIGRIALSRETRDEFKVVSARPKLDKYLSLAMRIELMEHLDSLVQRIELKHTISECRDPKDYKFLELAFSANARCIIWGDQDLLALDPFRGISLLSAKDFLDYNKK